MVVKKYGEVGSNFMMIMDDCLHNELYPENTKRDAASYDCCSYMHEILADGNRLYEAMMRARRSSSWKQPVQRFMMDYLLGLGEIRDQLRDGTYEFHPTHQFTISERGKTRRITSEEFEDRIVKHSLCDNIITPAISPHLIYDNGASIEGKGIDFTRSRVERHLHKYYSTYHTNKGYVLLFDFSKYYDNMLHSHVYDTISKYVDGDPFIMNLVSKILKRQEIDVSYLSDDEFSNCLNVLFNSLEYANVDKSLLVGEKMMQKHMDIGDQLSQDSGVSYPIPIDNYIKIKKRCKFYERYMDDGLAIHPSREYLMDLLHEVTDIANGLGIAINQSKTQICELSSMWRYLQVQYSLTDTGRVIHKINPERVVAFKHKSKALVNILSGEEFFTWYSCWISSHAKYLSKAQRISLIELYDDLIATNGVDMPPYQVSRDIAKARKKQSQRQRQKQRDIQRNIMLKELGRTYYDLTDYFDNQRDELEDYYHIVDLRHDMRILHHTAGLAS